MMRVLICGADGYIGWPLTLQRLSKGDSLVTIDDLSRRSLAESLTPISPYVIRQRELKALNVQAFSCSLLSSSFSLLQEVFALNTFDAIVHLAEQPSAPYSMQGLHQATLTQNRNIDSTLILLHLMKTYCPDAHLVKIGTMGEYGTPNAPISEGDISVDFKERSMTAMFPRDPGSWYHLSKVFGTYNIRFACKVWGLRATDIMQGVLYGVRTPEITHESLINRFDYDQCFGTVINRFCVQAINEFPITPYGLGGQKRGFLELQDALQCLDIVMKNPPEAGEHRVINQFHEVHSINDLAQIVKQEAHSLGMHTTVENIQNPRVEQEDHDYDPEHSWLLDHGFKASCSLEKGVRKLLEDITPYTSLTNLSALKPDIYWR